MKKIRIVALIVVAVIVAAAAVWQYAARNEQGPEMTTGREEQQKEQKFTLGEVVRVETDRIYFSVPGREEKTALVSDGTLLKKQIQTADEGIKVIDVSLSDFAPGAKIVVYYIEEPEGNEYSAVKIQNIDAN